MHEHRLQRLAHEPRALPRRNRAAPAHRCGCGGGVQEGQARTAQQACPIAAAEAAGHDAPNADARASARAAANAVACIPTAPLRRWGGSLRGSPWGVGSPPRARHARHSRGMAPSIPRGTARSSARGGRGAAVRTLPAGPPCRACTAHGRVRAVPAPVGCVLPPPDRLLRVMTRWEERME